MHAPRFRFEERFIVLGRQNTTENDTGNSRWRQLTLTVAHANGNLSADVDLQTRHPVYQN